MDPYEAAVMERIRELVRYRRWLRYEFRFLRPTLEPEYNAELHSLLRLVRSVRRAAKERSRQLARGDHFAGVSTVPGPDNREYLDDLRNDRELMRDEMHGRDIDGSLRW